MSDFFETESDQKFWVGAIFALGFFIGMAVGAVMVGILAGALA